VNHVEYTLARTRFDFDNFGAYQAAAFAVRDRLIESWNDTQSYHTVSNHKFMSDLYNKIEQRCKKSVLPFARIFDGTNLLKCSC